MGRLQLLRKHDVRQIFGIKVFVVDGIGDLLPARPEADPASGVSENLGQGGTPRTCTHHSNLHHALLIY